MQIGKQLHRQHPGIISHNGSHVQNVNAAHDLQLWRALMQLDVIDNCDLNLTRASTMTLTDIETLVQMIARLNEPCLVAIDGCSGVGKSSLAAKLVPLVDATLIAGDDFYAGGNAVHDHQVEKLADICIDRARLRPVLEALKAGKSAHYAAYDWEAFDGSLESEATIIKPKQVLLLEGVYANHPDLRDLVDFSILVTTSDQERERRLIAREGVLTEWERQWHRAEDWYFETLATAESFDAVFEND